MEKEKRNCYGQIEEKVTYRSSVAQEYLPPFFYCTAGLRGVKAGLPAHFVRP